MQNESTMTNTALNDSIILNSIRKLINNGVARTDAIKQSLKQYSIDETTDYISKFEVLLDTSNDNNIESQRPTVKKYSIPNQMIFKAGNWKGRKTSVSDLADAVKCYEDTKQNFKPIQKFTHKEFKDHQQDPVLNKLPFRVGDLENLRLVNDELYADRVNVPEPIYNMIKDGLISGHSAEFKENVTINGQKYKRFLYADALLGSELPALAPVMKPFFYDAENENNTFIYECETSINYDEEPIYYQNGDLKMKITKQAYEAKKQKCSDAGMKNVKSYEAFMEMEDDAGGEYLLTLDDYLKKEKEKLQQKESGMYSAEPETTETVDFYKAKLREYEEKAKYDAELEAKAKYDAEIEALKIANAEIQLRLANEQLQREKEANMKFVYSFTKNPSGPIFPISMENKLISMLNNMDKPNETTFKYSDEGQEVEGTLKANIQAVLKDLAKELSVSGSKNHKFVYSTDEYTETNRGNKVQINKRDEKINYSDEATIEYLEDDQAIQKYADEKGVSYEQACDIYYKTNPFPVEKPEVISLSK